MNKSKGVFQHTHKSILQLSIFLIIVLLVLGTVIFIFKDGSLAGRVTGDETGEYYFVNKVYSENSEIIFMKNITSLRVTGSFTGNGSAKIYLNVSGKLILVHEISGFEEIGGMPATGFVSCGDEIISEMDFENDSQVVFDDVLEEVIIGHNISDTLIESMFEINISEEVLVENTEGDNDISGNISRSIDDEISLDENISNYNIFEFVVSEIINGTEEETKNETQKETQRETEEETESDGELEIITEEIINETINEMLSEPLNDVLNDGLNELSNDGLNGSLNELLNDSLKESLNDNLNETLNETIYEAIINESIVSDNYSEENLSQKILFKSECMESCCLMPVYVSNIVLKVESGELEINEFVFVSSSDDLAQGKDIENISLNFGMSYFLNVADYFNDHPDFYDFSSSQGYSYYVEGPMIVLTPLKAGVWPARAYAAKDGTVINSNDFFVIVSNESFINESLILIEPILDVNETFYYNLSNSTNSNISAISNFSLPFTIDDALQELIKNNVSENVRVIIKYKKEVSNNNSIVEYVGTLKKSASEIITLKSNENLKKEIATKLESISILSEDIAKSLDQPDYVLNSGEENNLEPNVSELNMFEDNISQEIVYEELVFEENDETKNMGKINNVVPKKIKNVSELMEDKQRIIEELNILSEDVLRVELAERIINSNEFIVQRKIAHANLEVVNFNISDMFLLKDNENIESVYVDLPVSLLVDESVDLMMLQEAKDHAINNLNMGLNGSGSRICLVDTGVNSSVVDNFVFGFDVVNNDSDPADDNGHGTKVGYVLSRVSPGAEVIAVKVLDSEGLGYQSDILAGLDYCAQQSVDIISLSIGAGSYSGFCDNDLVAQKVNELADSGILVVAATGNDGSGLIKSPACASGALAVAASTKQDKLAAFSNFNDVVVLAAPGENILTKNIAGGDVLVSGTSMSVPFVSGTAALLLHDENYATLDVVLKKRRIVHTGDLINYSFVNDSGEHFRYFARVNVYNALTNNVTNTLEPLSVYDWSLQNETYSVLGTPFVISSNISPSVVYSNSTMQGFCYGNDSNNEALAYYYKWYKNDQVTNISGAVSGAYNFTRSNKHIYSVSSSYKSIFVSGNYAYLVQNNQFTVLNVTSKTNVTQVIIFTNTSSLNGAISVSVSGNYAYVVASTNKSLTVINITNPASPVQVGYIINATSLNVPASIDVNGNYAYVVSSSGKSLTIFDISVPSSPVQLGYYTNSTSLNNPKSIVVSGNYAYIASYTGASITIINISNPNNPIQKGYFTNSTSLQYANSVAVGNGYAYVASGKAFYSNGYLSIIDLSNPSNPFQVGVFKGGVGMDWEPRSVAFGGNHVYTVGYYGEVSAFDVIDPSNPILKYDYSDHAEVNGEYIHYKDGYVYNTFSIWATSSFITWNATSPQVEVNVNNVSTSYLSKDQNWSISCLVSDGVFNSSWFNSSVVTILNSQPRMNSSMILPIPVLIDSTLQGYCSAKDGDSDNVSYYYRWYVDGNMNESGVTSSNYAEEAEINVANISPSFLASGQNWILSCLAFDGVFNSSWFNSSVITIGVNPPIMNSSRILPSPAYSNNVLRGYCAANDSEGNNISYYYQWYKNGEYFVRGLYYLTGNTSYYIQGTEINVANRSLGMGARGNTWTLGCMGYDGNKNGSWMNSSALNISNILPLMNSSRILPEVAYKNDTLRGYCSANDSDYDTINYYYKWYKNGVSTISGNNSYYYISQAGYYYNSSLANAYALFIKDGLAFIPSYMTSSFTVINVTNPTNPVQIARLQDGAYLNGARSIFIVDDYAYVTASQSKSLAIINISNPTSPNLISYTTNASSLSGTVGVFVKDNYAYVTAFENDSFSVFDISNKTNIVRVGFLTNSSYIDGASEIYINGNYAYALGFYGSLATIDISEPTNPIMISKNDLGSQYPSDISIKNNYIYVTTSTSSRLYIYNISSSPIPEYVTYITISSTGNSIKGVHVDDRYAYVTGDTSATLSVVDISKPATPVIINSYYNQTISSEPDIFVSDGYAYLTLGGSLFILNITQPTSGELNVANVSSTNLSKGQNWILSCLANDGFSNTSWFNSSVLSISNYNPIMNSSRILPIPVAASDTLQGRCSATDVDSDNVSYYYQWYVNGVANFFGVTSRNYTHAIEVNVANVSSENLSSGQNWTLSCLANDGVSNSSWFNSSVITIGVNAPIMNSSRILPASAYSSSVLSGYCSANDSENDNISYYYQWYMGYTDILNNLYGAYVLNTSGSTLSNYVQGTEVNVNSISPGFTRSQRWVFSCKAFDGGLNSTSWINSAPLTILNSAPVMTSTISPSPAPVNTNLIGYCSATDTDLDSVKFYYQLYKNGVLNLSGSKPSAYVGPTYVSQIVNSTSLWNIRGSFISGNYAYTVSSGDDTFTIINITNPSSPAQLAYVKNATSLSGAYSISISGNYAYIVSYVGKSLTVFNITNPSSPVQIAYYTNSTSLNVPYSVFTSGDYVYVASSTGNSLTIFDVSNPVNPIQISYYTNSTTLSSAKSVFVRDNYAYVAANYYLTIINVSNPANPIQKSYKQSTRIGDPGHMFYKDGYVYITSNAGYSLTVVNVTDPSSPNNISTYDSYTTAHINSPRAVFVDGNYAYIASVGSDAISVFDVTNPAKLVYINYSSANLTDPWHVFVKNGYAYVSSGTGNSFTIFNVTQLYSSGTNLNVVNISGNSTSLGQNWTLSCLGYDGFVNSSWDNFSSVIINFAPTVSTVFLNSSSGQNVITDNLTITFNVSDPENNTVWNITDWRRNGTSMAIVNFPFDTNVTSESSGAILDYSTFRNNGTLIDASWISTGVTGGAYRFDGDGDYLSLPNSILNTSASVSLWFKANDVSKGYLWVYDNTDAPEIRIYLQNSITCVGYDNSAYQFSLSTAFSDTTSWHHVVCTWTENMVKLYVDGELVDTDSSSTFTHSTSSQNNIGYYSRVGDSSYFNGSIDDFRLFNRVLSPEQVNVTYQAGLASKHPTLLVSNEIMLGDVWSVAVTPTDKNSDGTTVLSNSVAIMNSPPVVSSVVLSSSSGNDYSTDDLLVSFSVSDPNGDDIYNITDWRKDATSIVVLNMPFEVNIANTATSAIRDYSTYSNNGTLGGGVESATPTWIPNGKIGSAYSFDGGDYVDIQESSSLNVGLGNWTIAAWSKTSQTSWGTVIGGYLGHKFILYGASGVGTARIEFNTGACDAIQAGPAVNDNNWHHIAAVRDNKNNKLILYVDGAQVGINADCQGTSSVTIEHINIGRENRGLEYFTGSIDDVIISNRAFSPEHINAMYQAGLSGRPLKMIVSNETIKGETWAVAVTATDTNSDSATVVSNAISLENTPPPSPEHSSPINGGRVIGNSQLLNWNAGGIDVDGDTITYYWRVDIDNPPSGVFTCSGSSTSTSSSACATVDGTEYYWNIITSDGYDNLSATSAWSFTENSKPSISSVILTPSLPKVTDDLNCSVSGWSDLDGDSAQYYFQWYNGTTLKFATGPTTNSSDILESENLTISDTWNCTVTPYDGYENATPLSASKIITSIPVMNSSRILPSTAFANDVLRGYCSANDTDGDNVSYYYRWYLGGVANVSGVTSANYVQAFEINVYNITSGLAKGQSWILSCLAFDGVSNSSAWMNSSIVTISNTPPPIPVHSSPGNAIRVTGNSQILSWGANGVDVDGDIITYYWRVDVDNPPSGVFTCSGSSTSTSSSACTTVDGTEYYWNVISGDNQINNTATSTWSFTENTKPSISNVNITPNYAKASDDLYCSVSGWSDLDGDSAQYYFQWYNGTTLKFATGPTTNTSDILGKNNLTSGETWNCTVTPYDGYENGISLTTSKTITSPPVVNSSRILPSIAFANDVLRGYCSANDTDGDNVSYYYRWYLGGVANLSGVTSANYVQAFEINVYNITSGLVKGQQWILSCLAFDGVSNSSTWINSSILTISNSVPTIPTVILNASSIYHTVNDDLTVYIIDATDVDGDNIYNITDWRRNGNSIAILNMPFDTNVTSTDAGAIIDYSTFGNDGTLTGALWSSTGKSGGAYTFTGTTDKIQLSTPLITGTGDFTFVAWTYSTDGPASDVDYIMGNYGLSNNGIEFYYYNTSGKYILGVYAAGGSKFGTTAVSVGAWHHVVAVRTNGNLTMYIDGVYYDSATITNSIAGNLNFVIGNGPDYTSEKFEGLIDSVQVYNYSLSSEQIVSIYDAGVAAHNPEMIVSEETEIGDVWSVAVTPTDRTSEGETAISNNLTIDNMAPVVNSSRILPSTAYANDTLRGYCSANDGDGNSVHYNYRWYQNAELNVSGATSSSFAQATEGNVNNISSGLAKGQIWIFSCQANDTMNTSSWMNSSEVMITNLAPVMNSSRILPTPAYTNDTLRGFCSANDADGDNVSYYWSWYKDGATNENGNEVGSFNGMCYQETANVSTSCGGLSTGSYNSDGDWIYPEYIYDGNWTTYAFLISEVVSNVYVNYTKPSGALNTSAIKARNMYGIYVNLTIPDRCWNYDSSKLVFKLTATYAGPVMPPCLNDKTKILTANGTPIISDLKIGDLIYTFNGSSLELNKITAIWPSPISNARNIYYYIYYNNGTEDVLIKATYNHRFYVGGDYIPAENLNVGDLLLDYNLIERPIINISIVANNTDNVWDITVENNNNFFAEGVLVHNAETESSLYCYNGSHYEVVQAISGNTNTYEEAMWWNISGTPTTTHTSATEVNLDNITSGLSVGDSWIFSCRANDGVSNSSLWLNSSTLTIGNLPPPKVNLSYPESNDSHFINRTPTFNWSAVTDPDGDSVTYEIYVSSYADFSDQIINESGISNNYYLQTDELTFKTYYWKVRANDTTAYGEWSDIWNFTLESYIEVELVNSGISFGTVYPQESKNTQENDPLPFVFTSRSNTYANMYEFKVNESLWESVELDTDYWQMKARSTQNNGTFNESDSKINWFNVTNTSYVVTYLNYSVGKNNVIVDVNIKGPNYESPGGKDSSVIFYWGDYNS
ncbi:MAG: LamG-like jellyroll fold domain-containing protein [Candidatus Nanoarchaeia archaeon]